MRAKRMNRALPVTRSLGFLATLVAAAVAIGQVGTLPPCEKLVPPETPVCSDCESERYPSGCECNAQGQCPWLGVVVICRTTLAAESGGSDGIVCEEQVPCYDGRRCMPRNGATCGPGNECTWRSDSSSISTGTQNEFVETPCMTGLGPPA